MKQHTYIGKQTQGQNDARYKRRAQGNPVAAQAIAIRNSGRWKRFQAWYIRLNPLCANPHEIEGHLAPAVDVHHIAPLRDHPNLAYNQDNCMALCRRCHNTLTRTEKKARDRKVGK